MLSSHCNPATTTTRGMANSFLKNTIKGVYTNNIFTWSDKTHELLAKFGIFSVF